MALFPLTLLSAQRAQSCTGDSCQPEARHFGMSGQMVHYWGWATCPTASGAVLLGEHDLHTQPIINLPPPIAATSSVLSQG